MARTDQLLDVLFNLQKSKHPSGASTGCLPVSLQLSLSLSLRLTPPFISSSTIYVVLSTCYLVLRSSISLCCLWFCPSFSHRGQNLTAPEAAKIPSMRLKRLNLPSFPQTFHSSIAAFFF